MTTYYGHELEWVRTTDVKVGDRIACLLSDASAFPVITGWSDKTLDLTRYELGVAIHRVFRAMPAPWWCDDAMTTGTVSDDQFGVTPIVKRAEAGSRCQTCHRDAHHPGEWAPHGHPFTL